MCGGVCDVFVSAVLGDVCVCGYRRRKTPARQFVPRARGEVAIVIRTVFDFIFREHRMGGRRGKKHFYRGKGPTNSY